MTDLDALRSRSADVGLIGFVLAVRPITGYRVAVAGRPEFDEGNVDAAIDYVISNGAEDRAQTISYSRVFVAAGLPPPQDLHFGGESHLVTQFMARFHHRCIERKLPPLDALVVHVAGMRQHHPGAGYFRVNGHDDPFGERTKPERQVTATRFWEAQVSECREWGVRRRRGH